MTFEAPKRRNRGLGLAAAGRLRQTAPCADRPAEVDPDADPAAAILLRVDPPRAAAEPTALLALATAALPEHPVSAEPLLALASPDPAAPAAESVSGPLPNMAMLVLRGLCIAAALLVLAVAPGVWLAATVFHAALGGLA